MARLRSDSPLAKDIVRSFLHFLSSVEITPEVDSEAVLVASQCLVDAFGVNVPTSSDTVQPDLVQLFKQSGCDVSTRELPDSVHTEMFTCKQTSSHEGVAGSSHPSDKACAMHEADNDVEERLFEQFKDGLESAGFFDGLSHVDSKFQELLDMSKSVFAATVKKVKKPGVTEQVILAESFKAQGNSSMSNSRFIEAIDLYTMAISLCGDNAVYYSNRAAAHTQVGKYEAAIADSNKAIQLDPNYSKAYSRLGLAYYTQGRYQEAIEKGFQKAHMLDPNSKSIQENLMVAQKKLEEEQANSRQSNSEPSDEQPQMYGNYSQGSEARYSTSIPLNFQVPQDMANIFPAVANLAAQFVGEQAGSAEDGLHGVHMDGQPPDIRMDGNVNVTVEGNPQFAGLMQSMLQMFAGAANQTRTEQPPNPNPSQDDHQSSH